MKTCNTCPSFAALAQECRAEPPQPVMVQSPTGQPVVLGVWPATREDHWCAKHPERMTCP